MLGANVNAADQERRTPLHTAAEEGKAVITQTTKLTVQEDSQEPAELTEEETKDIDEYNFDQ